MRDYDSLQSYYNPQYIADCPLYYFRISTALGNATLEFTDFTPETMAIWPSHRHMHTCFDVHILLNGRADFEHGSETTHLVPCTGVLTIPGVMHTSRNPTEDLERFTCMLYPEAGSELEQLLYASGNRLIQFTCTDQIVDQCRKITAELRQDEPLKADLVTGMFQTLLILLLRRMQLQIPETPIPNHSVESILDGFFFPNPYSYGTKQDLAAQLHVSARQLDTILLKHYGMNFRDKMLQSRMEYAGSLLQHTDHRIADIAAQVGYKEESSFFKAFHAYYQMTPQQYRIHTRQTDPAQIEEAVSEKK